MGNSIFPTPSKLLVLVAVVLAVWYGFKWIGKLDAARKQAPRKAARPPEVEGIETVSCPVCGTYFPSSVGSHCGGSRCQNRDA